MDIIAAFGANLATGLNEAVSLSNLWYCFFGVFLGTLVGVGARQGSCRLSHAACC